MSNPAAHDPYNEVAITGPQSFELRGSGLVVPLLFAPDAAYIARVLLKQDEGFSKDIITEAPEFDELCDGPYANPVGRFIGTMSHLRFTFNALQSTIIQVTKDGSSNIYRRNSSYAVIDEPGLLRK